MFKIIGKAIFHLFSENDKTLSVGRVSFWIAFGIACSIWMSIPPIDIPMTLFYLLGVLLLYNTCKKVLYMLTPGFVSFMSRGRINVDASKKACDDEELEDEEEFDRAKVLQGKK